MSITAVYVYKLNAPERNKNLLKIVGNRFVPTIG